MLETWILILLLKTGYAGGVISQEFNSRTSCIAALAEIKSQTGGVLGPYIYGVCVKK